jgi:hypothetical protein
MQSKPSTIRAAATAQEIDAVRALFEEYAAALATPVGETIFMELAL